MIAALRPAAALRRALLGIPALLVLLAAPAIAATPEGGRILVALNRRKSGARIVISDSGEGMKPSELARAMDGYRLEGSNGRDGKRGLGLPLARQLIEAHGGQLEIQSEKGAGTTATVLLP